MHKLANLRGAPNLHAQIVQAPEFFKLKQLIREPCCALLFCTHAITAMLAFCQGAWLCLRHTTDDHHVLHCTWRAPSPTPSLRAVQRRKEFTARNLSNTLWSLAKANHHPGVSRCGADPEQGAAMRRMSATQPARLCIWLGGSLPVPQLLPALQAMTSCRPWRLRSRPRRARATPRTWPTCSGPLPRWVSSQRVGGGGGKARCLVASPAGAEGGSWP